MNRAILVLNAGSSSLKFSLHEILADNQLRLVVRGQIEGLGTYPHFKAKEPAGQVLADANIPAADKSFTHADGFRHLSAFLRDHYADRLKLTAVGHRVVHGGSDFVKPTLITPAVFDKLTALIPLVPLHQPHNLAAVKAVTDLRPDLPQVACFDTAFHQGRTRVTQRLGLPDSFFQQGLRRWGFHGLSYEFVSQAFREVAPDLADGRVIAAHLGSGASLCAMRHGKCVDTTMGFSALDGLCMGTRCGALDPGALLHLLRTMSRDEVESLLYKKSGLLGISGVSNDVRELLASDNPLAAEALDFFVYRVTREIAALTAPLGGLDALIFTAGIGENCPPLRARICAGLSYFGIAVDKAANEAGRQRISPPGTHPSVWVIPTDEEAVIASHTVSLLQTNENVEHMSPVPMH